MIGFAEVSDILWRERELLDVLLFKLQTEKLLLDAGELRWLSRSTREIELVLEQLRLAEINRAIEVDALATQLGLPLHSNLAALASAAPSPWGDLFRAHRTAFHSLTAQIDALAEANRASLDAACSTAEITLVGLGAADLADQPIPRQPR
ncbi:MAG TPA: flagellar export chaperone FlgN [Acidothermaceae bacterium]